MDTTSIGITEKEDEEEGIHQQDIFHGMVFFLAAITRFLFSRVLGADDAPFGAVMGKRGEAGPASSSSGMTAVATSASTIPSRWASAVRERAGASPRVRRAASSAGKRT